MRSWIIAFFGFSRSETNGFLILLPLMTILVFSAPVYRWWRAHTPSAEPVNARLLDSLAASSNWVKPDSSASARDSLFSFNPNTASPEDLKRLGFSQPLAARLDRYRIKGGKFRTRRDLRKLYGIDSSLIERLYPYIDLPERIAFPLPTKHPLRKAQARDRFDLNLADTARLVRVYGIGPKLSLRIVTYRDRLGGFISLHQLTEVYGLDSAVIDQLKKEAFIDASFKPRQINVNSASEKELASLPYIKFHLAKSITAYRFQHGDFASVENLKQLALMDESLFEKIKPYLTVKD